MQSKSEDTNEQIHRLFIRIHSKYRITTHHFLSYYQHHRLQLIMDLYTLIMSILYSILRSLKQKILRPSTNIKRTNHKSKKWISSRSNKSSHIKIFGWESWKKTWRRIQRTFAKSTDQCKSWWIAGARWYCTAIQIGRQSNEGATKKSYKEKEEEEDSNEKEKEESDKEKENDKKEEDNKKKESAKTQSGKKEKESNKEKIEKVIADEMLIQRSCSLSQILKDR